MERKLLSTTYRFVWFQQSKLSSRFITRLNMWLNLTWSRVGCVLQNWILHRLLKLVYLYGDLSLIPVAHQYWLEAVTSLGSRIRFPFCPFLRDMECFRLKLTVTTAFCDKRTPGVEFRLLRSILTLLLRILVSPVPSSTWSVASGANSNLWTRIMSNTTVAPFICLALIVSKFEQHWRPWICCRCALVSYNNQIQTAPNFWALLQYPVLRQT